MSGHRGDHVRGRCSISHAARNHFSRDPIRRDRIPKSDVWCCVVGPASAVDVVGMDDCLACREHGLGSASIGR